MPKRNWIRLIEGEDGGSETPPADTSENNTDRKDAQSDPKPTETVDFWKAMARDQEKRAKANAEAAERLGEIEEAQKTDSQRSSEALQKETARADDAESRLLRYEVMDEKEVPANARRLVHGSSRSEIESSCDDVLSLIGDASKPRTPKSNPAQRENDESAGDKDALAKAFFNISK